MLEFTLLILLDVGRIFHLFRRIQFPHLNYSNDYIYTVLSGIMFATFFPFIFNLPVDKAQNFGTPIEEVEALFQNSKTPPLPSRWSFLVPSHCFGHYYFFLLEKLAVACGVFETSYRKLGNVVARFSRQDPRKRVVHCDFGSNRKRVMSDLVTAR